MVSPAPLRHSAHGYNVAPTACAMAKTKRQQTRTRRHRARNANLQCCVAAPTTVGKHACSLTPTCKPHAQSQQHRAAEHSSVRTGTRGAQTEMASINTKTCPHTYIAQGHSLHARRGQTDQRGRTIPGTFPPKRRKQFNGNVSGQQLRQRTSQKQDKHDML